MNLTAEDARNLVEFADKRFKKIVRNPETGRTKTVRYGQAGKAKDGGDRIRPGTSKGDSYCARSNAIQGDWRSDPNSPNNLSRKKWKCRGDVSMKSMSASVRPVQFARGDLLKKHVPAYQSPWTPVPARRGYGNDQAARSLLAADRHARNVSEVAGDAFGNSLKRNGSNTTMKIHDSLKSRGKLTRVMQRLDVTRRAGKASSLRDVVDEVFQKKLHLG